MVTFSGLDHETDQWADVAIFCTKEQLWDTIDTLFAFAMEQELATDEALDAIACKASAELQDRSYRS